MKSSSIKSIILSLKLLVKNKYIIHFFKFKVKIGEKYKLKLVLKG